jgi:hypothetical protein
VHARAKFPQRAVNGLANGLANGLVDGKQTLPSIWPVNGPLWAGVRRRPLTDPLTGNGRIRPLTVNGVRELRHAGRQTGPIRRLLRVSDYDLATEGGWTPREDERSCIQGERGTCNVIYIYMYIYMLLVRITILSTINCNKS